MLSCEKNDAQGEKRYAGNDGKDQAEKPKGDPGPAQEFSPD
jgi:hypothetical protein